MDHEASRLKFAAPIDLPDQRRDGHQPRLVEWQGMLPEQPASFLSRLSSSDKREVYVLLGFYPEVRGLLGAARLLHAFLKAAPEAAAQGRTTFEEHAQERADIRREIAALRQKINRLAENVCLILPRVPNLHAEEVLRETAAHRRVS